MPIGDLIGVPQTCPVPSGSYRASSPGANRESTTERTLDGRRLWETRDDRKWGHDKFEEMSVHERPYNEGRRMPRGRNRGRGRGRGDNREFLHENRTKALDNNYQNGASKSVRGRGQRRYRPVTKNNVEAPANNRSHLIISAKSFRPSKSLEKASHASTERASAAASTSESNQVSSRNTAASSLNSASPPFYPSASSNQEINSTQKGSSQTGHVSRSNNMRESGVPDTLGMEKLYIDNSGSSYQARNKGRGQTGQAMPGQRVYQPVPSHNQANRAPTQNQPHAFQQTPSFHSAGQQLRSRSASGSQASSTPKVSGPIHSLESTELESYDSKMLLAGKGKGGNHNNGNNPFLYTGNIGGNHGDQNFPGASTFLPVMQFAGQQHPGGITAVGMAFPGYVGQPNGMGNSEMTWLPVLAGAARGLGATGAMGAAYPPYITMDGSYHAQTSGQA
ncbi:protein MLN51, partial [Tanacetum coccineum]